MRIEDVDKNLVVETTITEPDIVWLNARDLPFEVTGVFYDEERGAYYRMPQDIAEQVSKSVGGSLNRCTAGGKLRFRTDSSFIGIRVVTKNGSGMAHMPRTGQSGFDLYHREGGRDTFYRTFVPPVGVETGYSSGIRTTGDYLDYTVNFPLYDRVSELYIALKKGARISAPTPFEVEKPMVFYGSSVTQGGCASRPGNAYPAILSRRLSCDHVNLGFSGSGKGEPRMAEYIAGLPMSVFVMDYDYNAPDVEYLKATHEPFFKIIREANPTLPVVFASASNIKNKREVNPEGRRAVIRETYERAVAAGDKNVYFIDGEEIFGDDEWDACTVDGAHPNDLGFYRYAERFERTLRPIIEEIKSKK